MAQGRNPRQNIPFPGPGGYDQDSSPIPTNAQRPVVVIESPYSGDIEKNTMFARNVCRFWTLAGFAPIASHLNGPQFLDEENPNERILGIHCGFAVGARAASFVVFALPPWQTELSRGMSMAMDFYRDIQKDTIVVKFNEEGTQILSSEWV